MYVVWSDLVLYESPCRVCKLQQVKCYDLKSQHRRINLVYLFLLTTILSSVWEQHCCISTLVLKIGPTDYKIFTGWMILTLPLLVRISVVHVPVWSGFRENTDSRSTDPLLTPLLSPLLTPYKINGKMKINKAQKYQLDRFKFINKLAWNFQDGGRVADFRLSCSPLTV